MAHLKEKPGAKAGRKDRMKGWIAAVSVLVLAGCQTQQIEEMSYSERMAVAEQIVKRCMDQGVQLRTPQMDACTRAESQREVYTRRQNLANARRAQASIAGGLAQHGQNMQRQAAINAASMPRTVNCRTQPMGAGTYNTSCY